VLVKSKPVIEVNDLKVYFHTIQGVVKAVDGVTFSVFEGETLGIVGESGCGKSISAQTLMQLVPQPPGRIEGGSIQYHRNDREIVDIAALNPRGEKIREFRGQEMGMVFQEPMTSLNPVYTVGQQIVEALLVHEEIELAEAKERAIDMMNRVRISSPAQRYDEYPFQLSGGMRQRVMIAMALICNPRVLIADEPTTALDVTIEAQILEIIREMQNQLGMSILMITHDMGVIGEMADDVIVMYMGQVVEKSAVDELFGRPLHPYTVALLDSVPRMGITERLKSIGGSVPNPYAVPSGCPFHPRCPKAMDVCKAKRPPTFTPESGHDVACWLYE
jgi:oligopeptide/dipeptide ABC transporter ATP-binding protein